MTKNLEIPNFFSFSLRRNGCELDPEQRDHFYRCLSKIYMNAATYIYRGDKKEDLYSIFGLNIDCPDADFRDSLFLFGNKAKFFFTA